MEGGIEAAKTAVALSGGAENVLDHAAGTVVDATKDAAGTVVDVTKDSINMIKGFFKSDEQKESNKLFHEMDVDGDNTASMNEMVTFVASHEELWEYVSITLNVSKEDAMRGAAITAMELATGKSGQEAMTAELTKQQFYEFRMKYIKDPEGLQEFFHRSTFAIFDTNNDGVLDEKELDKFLDIVCSKDSKLMGSAKNRPPKEKLHQIILKYYDTDGDKELPFEEVRSIIARESFKAVEQEIAEAAEAAAKYGEEEDRKQKEEEERKRKENLRREKELEKRIEQERKEEWSICDWFFVCRNKEGERETLCMRLSRHGCSKHE